MFLYESDNQEADIEWLSDPSSQSNIDSGRGRALFYTNQAVTAGTAATSETGEAPSDAFSTVHNYRIDWDGKSSAFYLDGALQHKFTTNVPTAKDGHWMWNNWS
jgi:beta-glucanase (GH16 family)